MKTHRGVAMLFVLLWSANLSLPIFAQQPVGDEKAMRAKKIDDLSQSISDRLNRKEVRISRDKAGYIRSLYTPSGVGVEVNVADKSKPENVAKEFLRIWRDVIVNPSDKIHFDVSRSRKYERQTHLVFDQYYSDLKIFGAQINLEVDENAKIKSLHGNLMTDSKMLDDGVLKLQPTIGLDDAKRISIDVFTKIASVDVTPLAKILDQELMIYDPRISNEKGNPRLVWRSVVKIDLAEPILEQVFVDAHNGELVTKYSLICNLKDRRITVGDVPKRTEGQGPAGITDVDYAYIVFGDIYDYYYSLNGRDSYNGIGGQIVADVMQPMDNAYWDGNTNTMAFGLGFATDDVIAHEFTHGVTQYMSGLEYRYESGAINESFSDMWGEWFDQMHNYSSPVNDQDGAQYDWLMGEDTSIGVIRDMRNPPAYDNCPDRYKGPLWDDGANVHYNSGVGNKLCYLITNGDTFNGLTISGLGFDTAERLFYGAQQHLVSTSGYGDLYPILMHVAGSDHLNLSAAQKQSIEKACQAVNIRFQGNESLRLKNASGETVAILYDSGRIKLLKTVEIRPTLAPPADAYIVKDGNGVTVAYIDTSTNPTEKGKLYLKGTSQKHTIPSASSSNAFVLSYLDAPEAGVPVVTIDNAGNLKAWNEIEESATMN